MNVSLRRRAWWLVAAVLLAAALGAALNLALPAALALALCTGLLTAGGIALNSWWRHEQDPDAGWGRRA